MAFTNNIQQKQQLYTSYAKIEQELLYKLQIYRQQKEEEYESTFLEQIHTDIQRRNNDMLQQFCQ